MLIEILILHTLKKYDCTMYTASKIIKDVFFAYSKPSFGSLNPAIKRLIKQGCIEEEDKITSGGKLSKMLSLTQTGEKFLKDNLMKFEFTSPSSFLVNFCAYFMCADVLTPSELKEFKSNMEIQLKIYKNHLVNNLNNPYNNLGESQKNVIQKTFLYAESLENLCR